jgi:predicted tellurium resistance membrane protein TerC
VAELFTLENAVALLTLTSLEVVLGIDNIVFISILASRLPANQQAMGRRTGLLLAMLMRIALLFAIAWVIGLTRELFSLPRFWTAESGDRHVITGRDLILLFGGLFLIGKATYEIHDKLEGEAGHNAGQGRASLPSVLIQIMLLDLVFSLDSVITAVGMVQTRVDARWIGFTIMITAVVISIVVMLAFAERIAGFVERHPTMKILALSFLILIGVMLVAESFHAHIPKGYIYFAMAFSLVVELLNMRLRRVSAPVKLHQSYVKESGVQVADSGV